MAGLCSVRRTRLKDWPIWNVTVENKLFFAVVLSFNRWNTPMLSESDADLSGGESVVFFQHKDPILSVVWMIIWFYTWVRTRTRGLMLQECGKDGIWDWQHSCVFPVWTNCTKSYLGHRFGHFIGHTFLPHVQSTRWYTSQVFWNVWTLKTWRIFGTQIPHSRQCFGQSQCVTCEWPSGSETKYIYLLSPGHHLKNVDWQNWKLEVWSH